LYRYHPGLLEEGKNPFILDSKAPSLPLEQYAYNETSYRMLLQSLAHGIGQLTVILANLQERMVDHEYDSIATIKGT
jgi:hypothetical protein